MAEYYSVIHRAVAVLEINTLEDRRAIYNRARAVQEFQLGKRPFNKANYDRERSMLENAISRVEAEATNKRIITYSFSREPAAVPDPVVGTGVLGLIAACAGLLGWRRKGKAQAGA